MFARVARYEIPVERIDEAEGTFQKAIDEIRGMAGVTGAYLLVSADSGRVLTMTLWENHQAMESSRVTASQLRSRAAGALEGSVVSAEEYAVAARESG
jgi:heme-degrading monooxygenase HmoA